jgi:hypothetical protein
MAASRWPALGKISAMPKDISLDADAHIFSLDSCNFLYVPNLQKECNPEG